MIKNSTYRPVLVCLSLLLFSVAGWGQRISFSPTGTNNILITPFYPNDLVFDYLVVNSGIVRTIQLRGENDNDVVVLAVDAPAEYDLTVWVTALDKLEITGYVPGQGEEMPSIPFQLRFAFANAGYALTHNDVASAKLAAQEVPAGFNTATFAVSKRSSGPPGPPPTPQHQGYDLPMARAYLFFYGTIGPTNAGTNVRAGNYETEIEVSIDFTTH